MYTTIHGTNKVSALVLRAYLQNLLPLLTCKLTTRKHEIQSKQTKSAWEYKTDFEIRCSAHKYSLIRYRLEKCIWMFKRTNAINKGYPKLQHPGFSLISQEKDIGMDLVQNDVKWTLFRKRASLINWYELNPFLPKQMQYYKRLIKW